MIRAASQLALDLQRPVPNTAAARVLFCLGECLPPGALDPMYRRIIDASFESVDRFSGSARPCAVADMILFDGARDMHRANGRYDRHVMVRAGWGHLLG